jgi:hypothetical protein
MQVIYVERCAVAASGEDEHPRPDRDPQIVHDVSTPFSAT